MGRMLLLHVARIRDGILQLLGKVYTHQILELVEWPET